MVFLVGRFPRGAEKGGLEREGEGSRFKICDFYIYKEAKAREVLSIWRKTEKSFGFLELIHIFHIFVWKPGE